MDEYLSDKAEKIVIAVDHQALIIKQPAAPMPVYWSFAPESGRRILSSIR